MSAAQRSRVDTSTALAQTDMSLRMRDFIFGPRAVFLWLSLLLIIDLVESSCPEGYALQSLVLEEHTSQSDVSHGVV